MKNIVCVFAHPDDEAFGPGGTIAKFSKKNNIYILCATKGDAGKKSKKFKVKSSKLGDIRAEELRRSAKILGVKKVFFLGFKDGELNNNLYHKLASKIRRYLLKLKPETVITFEPRGVSGHIDHITTSLAAMFVLRNLKFVKKIYQYCVLDRHSKFRKNYFIYFPQGYKYSEVQLVVDISNVWDKKVEAMRAHKSQAHDVERILKLLKNQPKEEHFLVVKP